MVTAAGLTGITWCCVNRKSCSFSLILAITILIYAVLTFANYAREAAEKRQVRGAFGQYLSPALVEQLAENPEKLRLGGETKEMTLLFCDVRLLTISNNTSRAQGLAKYSQRAAYVNGRNSRTRRNNRQIHGRCIMAF